ncbi:MAG: hypothetical protein A2W17_03525 [Planctomycetes bacterium RBG_16_41_13]|nr:MAG: hypothetical protein A2W17_03525 [Planctomycetes bacterium RBG_16_41_13]
MTAIEWIEKAQEKADEINRIAPFCLRGAKAQRILEYLNKAKVMIWEQERINEMQKERRGEKMKNLDVLDFKFKIGDIAYHKLNLKDKYAEGGYRNTPVLIVSRMVEECSGGIQLFYLCRLGVCNETVPVTFDPSNLHKINECELILRNTNIC